MTTPIFEELSSVQIQKDYHRASEIHEAYNIIPSETPNVIFVFVTQQSNAPAMDAVDYVKYGSTTCTELNDSGYITAAWTAQKIRSQVFYLQNPSSVTQTTYVRHWPKLPDNDFIYFSTIAVSRANPSQVYSILEKIVDDSYASNYYPYTLTTSVTNNAIILGSLITGSYTSYPSVTSTNASNIFIGYEPSSDKIGVGVASLTLPSSTESIEWTYSTGSVSAWTWITQGVAIESGENIISLPSKTVANWSSYAKGFGPRIFSTTFGPNTVELPSTFGISFAGIPPYAALGYSSGHRVELPAFGDNAAASFDIRYKAPVANDDYTGDLTRQPIVALDSQVASSMSVWEDNTISEWRSIGSENLSENMLTYSEDYTSGWNVPRLEIISNAVQGPFDTKADKLQETTVNNYHYLYPATAIPFVVNNIYKFSAYVKNAGRRYVGLYLPGGPFPGNPQIWVDTTNGEVVSESATNSYGTEHIGDGWYYIWLTAISDVSASTQPSIYLAIDDSPTLSYTGDGSSGIYLWGVQVNRSEYGAHYTKTLAASVTADRLYKFTQSVTANRPILTAGDGHENLVTYSEDLTQNSSWSIYYCTIIDETTVSITGQNGRTRQYVTVEDGKEYEIGFEAKNISGNNSCIIRYIGLGSGYHYDTLTSDWQSFSVTGTVSGTTIELGLQDPSASQWGDYGLRKAYVRHINSNTTYVKTEASVHYAGLEVNPKLENRILHSNDISVTEYVATNVTKESAHIFKETQSEASTTEQHYISFEQTEETGKINFSAEVKSIGGRNVALGHSGLAAHFDLTNVSATSSFGSVTIYATTNDYYHVEVRNFHSPSSTLYIYSLNENASTTTAQRYFEADSAKGLDIRNIHVRSIEARDTYVSTTDSPVYAYKKVPYFKNDDTYMINKDGAKLSAIGVEDNVLFSTVQLDNGPSTSGYVYNIFNNKPKGRLAAKFVSANSEYLSISDNAALSTGDIDFTIAGWFKMNTLDQNHRFISKYGSAGSREYLLYYLTATNRFHFTISSDGTVSQAVDADQFGAPEIDTWYFLTAWHDANNDLYAIQVNDGTPDTFPSYTAGVYDSNAAFMISDDGTPMDGQAAMVGKWNRVLSSSEITQLYNNGSGLLFEELDSGLTEDLKAYWNLNETEGIRYDGVFYNHLTDNNTVTYDSGPSGETSGIQWGYDNNARESEKVDITVESLSSNVNADNCVCHGTRIESLQDIHGSITDFVQSTTANQPWITRADNKENRLIYSNGFGTYWGKTRVTVTQNSTTNPVNGAQNAHLVYEDSDVGLSHGLGPTSGIIFNGQTYRFSICAKYKERHIGLRTDYSGGGFPYGIRFFDLQNGDLGTTGGTLVDSGIEDLGNGWYRCWIEATASANDLVSGNIGIVLCSDPDAGTYFYNGDGSSGVYLYNAQLRSIYADNDNIVTDYNAQFRGVNGNKAIYYCGDQILRSASAMSDIFRTGEGVVYIVLRPENDVDSQKILNGDGLRYVFDISADEARFYAYDSANTAPQCRLDPTFNEVNIFKLRHDGLGLYMSINGGTEENVGSGNLIDFDDFICLGNRDSESQPYFGALCEVVTLKDTDDHNNVVYNQLYNKWISNTTALNNTTHFDSFNEFNVSTTITNVTGIFDASITSSLVEYSGRVSSWSDQTGSTTAFEMSTTANRPIITRADNKENRCLYTNDLSVTTFWTNSGGIGANDGELLTETSATELHYLGTQSIQVVEGNTYRLSAKCKIAGNRGVRLSGWTTGWSGGATFFLTGSGYSYGVTAGWSDSIKYLGEGWYQCTIEATATATDTSNGPLFYITDANGTTNYLGDGSSGVSIKDVIFQKAEADETYLANTDTAQYRGINGNRTLYFTGSERMQTTSTLNDVFGVRDKTIYLVALGEAFDALRPVFTDSSGYIDFGTDGTNQWRCYNWSGGSSNDIYIGDDDVTQPHILKIRHDTGKLHMSIDGGAEVDIESGDTDVMTGSPKIGARYNNTNYFYGHICEIILSDNGKLDTESEDEIYFNLYNKWKRPVTSTTSLLASTTTGTEVITAVDETLNLTSLMYANKDVITQDAQVYGWSDQLDLIHGFANSTTASRPYWTRADNKENRLTYSESLDAADWGNVRTSVTVNQVTNPVDNLVTADGLLESSGTTAQTHYTTFPSTNITSGRTYRVSIYAKPYGRDVFRLWGSGNCFPGAAYTDFDIDAGTLVDGADSTGSMTYVSAGWYHCSMEITANAHGSSTVPVNLYLETSAGGFSYTGDGSSGMYLYGAQLCDAEADDAVVITESVPNYRGVNGRSSLYFSKHSLTTFSTMNDVFENNAKTLYIVFKLEQTDDAQFIWTATGGGGYIYVYHTGGNIDIQNYTSQNNIITLGSVTTDTTYLVKMTHADTEDMNAYLYDSTGLIDSGSLTEVGNTASTGMSRNIELGYKNGSNPFYGHLCDFVTSNTSDVGDNDQILNALTEKWLLSNTHSLTNVYYEPVEDQPRLVNFMKTGPTWEHNQNQNFAGSATRWGYSTTSTTYNFLGGDGSEKGLRGLMPNFFVYEDLTDAEVDVKLRFLSSSYGLDNKVPTLPSSTVEHEVSQNLIITFLAKFNVTFGPISDYPGYYQNTDGFLNSNKYIQDSDYYQQFAYELQAGEPFNRYSKIMKKLLHPAGYKMFGKFVEERVVSADTSTTMTSTTDGGNMYLWLDGSDFTTMSVSDNGQVSAWRDKSPYSNDMTSSVTDATRPYVSREDNKENRINYSNDLREWETWNTTTPEINKILANSVTGNVLVGVRQMPNTPGNSVLPNDEMGIYRVKVKAGTYAGRMFVGSAGAGWSGSTYDLTTYTKVYDKNAVSTITGPDSGGWYTIETLVTSDTSTNFQFAIVFCPPDRNYPYTGGDMPTYAGTEYFFAKEAQARRLGTSGEYISTTNTPMFSYMNTGSLTGAENLLTYSEDLDNWYTSARVTYPKQLNNSDWTKTNVAITISATTNPQDGIDDVDKIVESSTTNSHFISQTCTNFFHASTTYRFSSYFKAAEREQLTFQTQSSTAFEEHGIIVDLSNGSHSTIAGTVYNSSLTSVTDNWYYAQFDCVSSVTDGLGVVKINLLDEFKTGLSDPIDALTTQKVPTFYFDANDDNCITAEDGYTVSSISSKVGDGSLYFAQSITAFRPILTRSDNLENFALYSEAFENAVWDDTSEPLTASDNSTTDYTGAASSAATLTIAGGDDRHYVMQSIPGKAWAGHQYRISADVKYGDWQYGFVGEGGDAHWHSVIVDLINGTISDESPYIDSSSIESLGNDWYRVTVEYTREGGAAGEFRLVIGVTLDDTFTSGAPENVDSDGSYIYANRATIQHIDADETYVETTAFPEYRGINGQRALWFDGDDDVLVAGAASNFINADSKEIFAAVRCENTPGSSGFIIIQSGNYWSLYFHTDGTWRNQNYDGTTDYVDLPYTINENAVLNYYHHNDILGGGLNGSYTTSVTSGDTTSVSQNTFIGASSVSGSNVFLGAIQSFLTFDQELTTIERGVVNDNILYAGSSYTGDGSSGLYAWGTQVRRADGAESPDGQNSFLFESSTTYAAIVRLAADETDLAAIKLFRNGTPHWVLVNLSTGVVSFTSSQIVSATATAVDSQYWDVEAVWYPDISNYPGGIEIVPQNPTSVTGYTENKHGLDISRVQLRRANASTDYVDTDDEKIHAEFLGKRCIYFPYQNTSLYASATTSLDPFVGDTSMHVMSWFGQTLVDPTDFNRCLYTNGLGTSDYGSALYLPNSSGNVGLNTFASATYSTYSTTTSVTSGTLQLWSIVKKNSDNSPVVNYYVDGVSEGIGQAQTNAISVTGGSFVIGNSITGDSSEGYRGYLPEVKIYSNSSHSRDEFIMNEMMTKWGLTSSITSESEFDAMIRALEPTLWFDASDDSLVATEVDNLTIVKSISSKIGDITFTQSTTTNRPLLTRSDNKENVVTYSENLEGADWNLVRASVSANAVANPINGAIDAGALVEDATAANNHYAYRNESFVNGQSYRCSAYAKPMGVNRNFTLYFGASAFGTNPYGHFDLQNGTIEGSGNGASASIESVGSGWYRVILEVTATNTAASDLYLYLREVGGNSTYDGDGASGVYIWGVQFQMADADTDYVKTTYFPEHRGLNGNRAIWFDGSNDILTSNSTLDDIYGESAKTLIIKFSWEDVNSGARYIFGDNAYSLLYADPGDDLGYFHNYAQAAEITSIDSWNGDTLIAVMTHNSTTVSLTIHNATTSTTAGTSASAGSTSTMAGYLVIGAASAGSGQTNMKTNFILTFDKVLDDDDIDTIVEGLKN
jgi:hypothetical protein